MDRALRLSGLPSYQTHQLPDVATKDSHWDKEDQSSLFRSELSEQTLDDAVARSSRGIFNCMDSKTGFFVNKESPLKPQCHIDQSNERWHFHQRTDPAKAAPS